jgi:hypothetical protein
VLEYLKSFLFIILKYFLTVLIGMDPIPVKELFPKIGTLPSRLSTLYFNPVNNTA